MTATTYPDTAYVAWGADESERGRFWIAVWGDEGPLSEEQYATDRDTARGIAARTGFDLSLPVHECDEFGPK